MIVLDAMGGDFAPKVAVEGAYEAFAEFGIKTALIGKRDEIRSFLPNDSRASKLEIIDASEVIEMNDIPSESFYTKPESSIQKGIQMIKENRADAFISAGNTGAVMYAAYKILGTMENISRPAITSPIPTPKGTSYLLDCGATAESKPQWLREFAIMGHIYCSRFIGIDNPSVGLLCNGTERTKGIRSLQEAYELISAEKEINFIGFIEPKDVLKGRIDLAVTDGFSGNIFLKTIEAWATMFIDLYSESRNKNLKSKIFSFLSKTAVNDVLERLNVSNYGGSPLLGINGLVVICHGESNAESIKNAIYITNEYLSKDFVKVISGETIRISTETRKREIPKRKGLFAFWKSIFKEGRKKKS